MTDRRYAPDYVSRETLAYRLEIAAGAVDQYVTRGVLPAPIKIGEALRWRWSDVEMRLAGASSSGDAVPDPYELGARHAASTR
jgi:hypothetical protein